MEPKRESTGIGQGPDQWRGRVDERLTRLEKRVRQLEEQLTRDELDRADRVETSE